MIRVGIVAALPAEARILSRKAQIGAIVRIGERCLLSVSGMGARRAEQAASALLQGGATALVSWGTAGGLNPEYRPGQLLLPEKVITTAGASFATDPVWCARVHRVLKNTAVCADGVMVTTDQVQLSAADKRSLHAQSGAVAVDLESGAIAASARSAGVPFLVIRAVVEMAGTSLPRHVLEQIDPYGRPHLWSLLITLARHPKELVTMAQLFINFRAALASLRLIHRQLGCDLHCNDSVEVPDDIQPG